jgi:hypothetical protein
MEFNSNLEERFVSKLIKDTKNGEVVWTDEDQWDWIERVKLEVIDAEGLSLYEFSYDFSLSKLFSAVRKASSGIDDIMKEYLKE